VLFSFFFYQRQSGTKRKNRHDTPKPEEKHKKRSAISKRKTSGKERPGSNIEMPRPGQGSNSTCTACYTPEGEDIEEDMAIDLPDWSEEGWGTDTSRLTDLPPAAGSISNYNIRSRLDRC